MKPITIITTLVLTAFSTAAFSQQADEEPITEKGKNSKWVVGLGIGSSLMNSPTYYPFNGTGSFSKYTVGINASLFARYYMNDNLALETGLEGTYFRSKKRNFPDHYTRASTLLFEVPITFQYHFFSRNAKFRPYLGVGASIYHTISKYEQNYEGASVRDNTSTYENLDVLPFSFTQGFTYQITDKLLLNQSLKYRLDIGAILNFNLGIGYTIGK